jgi:hypothetical protein
MMSLINKKSGVISAFWEKPSSSLKVISLDHKLFVRKTQALLEKETTNRPSQKRKQASLSSFSPSSKSLKKRDVDTRVEQIEHDCVALPVSYSTLNKDQ